MCKQTHTIPTDSPLQDNLTTRQEIGRKLSDFEHLKSAQAHTYMLGVTPQCRQRIIYTLYSDVVLHGVAPSYYLSLQLGFKQQKMITTTNLCMYTVG